MEYKFFDFLKSEKLPTLQEVIENRIYGITPVLVLDSCVCFDIIKYIENKSLKKEIEQKIINLFTYAENSKTDILGSFGILELSHNRKNYSINKNKFNDFGNKIDFAMNLTLQKLIDKDFTNFKKKDINSHSNIFPLLPMLNMTYCCLLKIRELYMENPKKINATMNLVLFLDWLNSELNTIMGVEFELAKLIFAGNNNFLPMLGLKKDKELSKRQLWGTTWDIFHYRTNTQYASTIKINQIQNRPYFVSNDSNLIKLAEEINNKAVMKSGNKIHGTYMHTKFENSCYKEDGDKIIEKMNDIRNAKRRILTEQEVNILIQILEERNNIS